jgi:hypothetical protein
MQAGKGAIGGSDRAEFKKGPEHSRLTLNLAFALSFRQHPLYLRLLIGLRCPCWATNKFFSKQAFLKTTPGIKACFGFKHPTTALNRRPTDGNLKLAINLQRQLQEEHKD